MDVFSLSNDTSNIGNTPVIGCSVTGVLSGTNEHPQKARFSAETRVLPTCFRPDGNTTPALKEGVCCRSLFFGDYPPVDGHSAAVHRVASVRTGRARLIIEDSDNAGI